MNIYSADFEAGSSLFDFSKNHGRQLFWIIVSLLIGAVILVIDSRFYSTFAFLFYGVVILLLIATLGLGREIAGSKSWLIIGGLRLQPSELAKFSTALALAKYLNIYGVTLSNLKHRFIAFGIIGLPVGLILLQNDFGSALVFLALFLVLFREGLPPYFLYLPLILGVLFLSVLLFSKILVIIALVLVALLFFWIIRARGKILSVLMASLVICVGFVFAVDYAFNNILQHHHRERINVLLGKEVDIKGAGYNVHQSLIAIGSGGLAGKGYLDGTQTKFNFVPEQSTDFIFCTVGEEFGFLGSSLLVIFFAILLIRIIISAESQKALFSRIYGYGVVSIFFIHFTFNIGMTLGLFPVIGIPLPFLSYGGSSLMGFTILLFIFLKLDSSKQEYFV